MPSPNMRDTLLKAKAAALPAGAATVTSTAIDLGPTGNGQFLVNGEFVLEAPALAVGALPNGKTLTYSIVTSDSSDLSSATVVDKSCIVQTGASGAGAAAVTRRFRAATNIKRYLGFTAVGVADMDASGSAATLSFVQ